MFTHCHSRILCLLKLLLIFRLFSESESVKLKDFGVVPLNKDDIALRFYATVENNDDEPFTVGLKMEKCCQFFKEGEPDCESMSLHSGLSLELFSKDIRNLTMYYISLYLWGRNGSCSVLLRWRSLDSNRRDSYVRQQFNVHFNTILPEQNFLLQYWQNDPDKYSLCSSVDEDPRNNCQPVNCLIKYSGFRSFYNETKKRCEKTRTCTDIKTFSPAAEISPSIVLSSISNKCINLWAPSTFTSSMQSLIRFPTMKSTARNYFTYPIKSICLNGYIQNKTQNCECNEGWTSTEFPSKTFNPNFDIYSMCDIRSQTSEEDDRAHSASVSFYMLLVISVMTLIVLCVYTPFCIRRLQRRRFAQISEEQGKKSENSQDVISEIKNRHEIALHPISNKYPIKSEISPTQFKSNRTPKKSKMNTPMISEKFTSLAEMQQLQLQLIDLGSKSHIPIKSRTRPTSEKKDKYITSISINNSAMPSKKLFFPQLSKSTLPSPLTPIKTGLQKSHSQVIDSNNNLIPAAYQISDILPTGQDSHSVLKLKFLLKEVESSRIKQLGAEITEITHGVTNESLDRFSAINLQQTNSSNRTCSFTEFWESVSDSDSDKPDECNPHAPQEDNNNKSNFWVNKLQTHL